MPGSLTTQGHMGACLTRTCMLPSVEGDSVGALKDENFVAQWLACTHLCQRFVAYLTIRDA